MSNYSYVTFCANCHKKFDYRTTERLCDECNAKWWKENGELLAKQINQIRDRNFKKDIPPNKRK